MPPSKVKKKAVKKAAKKRAVEKDVKKVVAKKVVKKRAPKKAVKRKTVKGRDAKVAKKVAAKKKVTKKTSAKTAAKKTVEKRTAKKATAEKKVTQRSAARSRAIGKSVNTLSGRRGQIASEAARFDLGVQQIVLEKALGAPPPGYHLTIVRGWVRAPGHLVAAWDINDEQALEQVERAGWERLCLRVLGPRDEVLAHVVLSRRSGTWHVTLPEEALSVRLVIGITQDDGFFQTLARSGSVRLPPADPSPELGEARFLELPFELDRRRILSGELPALPGHRVGTGGTEVATRLFQRVLVAATHGDAALPLGPACRDGALRGKGDMLKKLSFLSPPSASPEETSSVDGHRGVAGLPARALELARYSAAEESKGDVVAETSERADSWPTSPSRWGRGALSSPGRWGPTSPSRPFGTSTEEDDDG